MEVEISIEMGVQFFYTPTWLFRWFASITRFVDMDIRDNGHLSDDVDDCLVVGERRVLCIQF